MSFSMCCCGVVVQVLICRFQCVAVVLFSKNYDVVFNVLLWSCFSKMDAVFNVLLLLFKKLDFDSMCCSGFVFKN
jgi:hypothetical protein